MTKFSLRLFALCCIFALARPGHAAASGSPFTLVSSTQAVVTPGGLAAAQKTETPSVVSLNGTRLTFRQKVVRLVVVTGPENDMLSYRIGGRRSPTLVVARSAIIKLLFINTDDDMKHNIRFGAALNAYPSTMAFALAASAGTPELSPKSPAAFSGEEVTLKAPAAPGNFVYFCTVRGHAQGGMAGSIIVR